MNCSLQSRSSDTGTAFLPAGKGFAQPGVAPAERSAAVGPSRSVLPSRGTHYWLRALAVGAVLFVIGWPAYRWWNYAHLWIKTDNAYVAGHIHEVSARVSGIIQEVLVQENQSVAAGTVVARLDPKDFEIRLEQARAQLAQAQAQSEQARAQVAQVRAQVAAEQAKTAKADADLARAKTLFKGADGAIPKAEFDQATTGYDTAQACLRAAEAAVTSAAAVGTAAQAQETVAQAKLRDAELQLSYTEIHAPVSGRVGQKLLEVGNCVQPGQALLAVVQPEVWVTANFKETQVGRIKPGQSARIRLDAFPGRTFAGRVESLSPASGSEFALLPPENATGNFTRIVQRVPVKIVLEQQNLDECQGRIVPGMSAIAEVRFYD